MENRFSIQVIYDNNQIKNKTNITLFLHFIGINVYEHFLDKDNLNKKNIINNEQSFPLNIDLACHPFESKKTISIYTGKIASKLNSGNTFLYNDDNEILKIIIEKIIETISTSNKNEILNELNEIDNLYEKYNIRDCILTTEKFIINKNLSEKSELLYQKMINDLEKIDGNEFKNYCIINCAYKINLLRKTRKEIQVYNNYSLLSEISNNKNCFQNTTINLLKSQIYNDLMNESVKSFITIENDQKCVDSLYRIALYLEKEHNCPQNEIKIYKKIITISPEYYKAYLKIARCLIEDKKFDLAIKYIEKGIEIIYSHHCINDFTYEEFETLFMLYDSLAKIYHNYKNERKIEDCKKKIENIIKMSKETEFYKELGVKNFKEIPELICEHFKQKKKEWCIRNEFY